MPRIDYNCTATISQCEICLNGVQGEFVSFSHCMGYFYACHKICKIERKLYHFIDLISNLTDLFTMMYICTIVSLSEEKTGIHVQFRQD